MGLVRDIELFAEFQGVIANFAQIWTMNQEARQRDERRIGMILPVTNFFVVEAFVVLCAGVSKRVVIRMIRLNQNFAGTIAATSASRNLRD